MAVGVIPTLSKRDFSRVCNFHSVETRLTKIGRFHPHRGLDTPQFGQHFICSQQNGAAVGSCSNNSGGIVCNPVRHCKSKIIPVVISRNC